MEGFAFATIPVRVTPLYVQVHPSDNVAIIVNPEGVAPGAIFPSGLAAREQIPQAHKITLCDLAAGEVIVRYGQVIGHARRDTPSGSWLREDMLDLPSAPPLDSLPLATAVPAPMPTLEGYTFEGYRNPDGSTGTIWGQYHDTFVRTSAGWRLKRRRQTMNGNDAGFTVNIFPSERRQPPAGWVAPVIDRPAT